MNPFLVFTILFIIVSTVMILIILVQRAQGGGLAGAFGGAGGAGTDTVFGGRVGDALTWATVIAFAFYLLFAILLNRSGNPATAAAAAPAEVTPAEVTTPDPSAPIIPPAGGLTPRVGTNEPPAESGGDGTEDEAGDEGEG